MVLQLAGVNENGGLCVVGEPCGSADQVGRPRSVTSSILFRIARLYRKGKNSGLRSVWLTIYELKQTWVITSAHYDPQETNCIESATEGNTFSVGGKMNSYFER